MKRLLAYALLFGASTILVFYGYHEGFIRFNYPSYDDYPIRGIDISHHQGTIDWNLLSKQDLEFVYIKATEGSDFKDPAFRDNWIQAKKSGLYTGPYHFFTFCRPGSEQAKNFLNTVPRYVSSLPPVIDFEFGGNCKARPKKEDLIKEVNAWTALVEKKFGSRPIFYVTYAAYDKYLDGEIDDYQILVRDIVLHPRLKDGRAWTLWQYGNCGRIKGVQGPVDLNVFNGSRLEFKRLIPDQTQIDSLPPQ